METAVVEAAGRNKFGGWVKINGDFKNAGKSLTFDLSTLKKGDTIQFDGSGKYINNLTVTGQGAAVPASSSGSASSAPSNPGKSLEIARSVAVKAVLESPIMDELLKGDVAVAVQESKSIAEIYAQYIATGTV